MIVAQPDNMHRGSRPGSIIYEKRCPDGTLTLVEQVIKGNSIEFRSMWKNRVAQKMRASLIAALPTKTKGRDASEPAGDADK